MSKEPFLHDLESSHIVMQHLQDHAIFKVNALGFFCAWSIGVFWLFGYEEPEFIGQPATLIFPLETGLKTILESIGHRNFIENSSEAKLNDDDIEIQQWYRHKDGSHFWATTRTIPLCNSEGELESILQIVRDDSVRHQLETRLINQNTQLQSLARSKDDFLATISHELRTPLQSILGWLHIIQQDGIDDETKQRGLKTIEHSAMAQTQLIEDLLDVSRIITGKLRLNIVTMNLTSYVEKAIEVVKPTALAKGIQIQLAPSEAYLIHGDPMRIEQIMLNLFSNALKFTHEGGTVNIKMAQYKNTITVSVRDNGQGITPEFLPYIFDRFRQADSSDSRRHLGLGIGLALVYQLMELHGGTVSAESKGEGTGATFTLSFPFPMIR